MTGITLTAILQQIRTTPDGGWRISFDVAENEREQVMALSEHRTGLIQLGIVPVGQAPAITDDLSWGELEDQPKNSRRRKDRANDEA